MKKLTSKMSKSFLLFQRALVLLGFAVCSLLVNAGGSYYYGDLTIQKYVPSPSINPLGKGKVYMKYYESAWGQTKQGDASVEFDCTNTQQSKVLNAGDHSYASGSNIYVGIAIHPIGTNSFFAGWYDQNGNSTSVSTNNNLGNRKPTVDANAPNVEYYLYNFPGNKDENNPATATLQAHFGRKVHIMSYDGEGDAWVDNISTDNPDRYAYSANITSSQFSMLYNLVLHSKLGDKEVKLKANDNSPFNLSLEAGPPDAEGRKTWRLTVTPKGVAESYVDNNVVFQIDGADVVTLALNLSRKPITVTLNPAEDLTGTYKYTQNTTGSQEFQITTSKVEKVMATPTDYSFSFNPTPNDATKAKFEKWVIKDAEGNVIAEPITPNLSYRFSGGESITPVFTTFDRAVFIVKSEPNIKYLDLQQALDRAAELGAGQVVVVTVEGNRKGGRLVQGEYVIRNGVTLLVPGESSYTPLVGKITTDNLSESGSSTPFCTLTVEDNTKITVEDGNISVYAKIKCQPTNGTILTPGHIQLGKNCEIIVKKGNLCSYGFITGDNSSHIIMKNGTTAYEAFQFADWRGGDETNGMKDNNYKVFPVGQYYIQSIEVPITFEYGSKEILATGIQVSIVGKIEANVNIIDTYSADLCLFGIDDGATVTKMYDPTTDRIKYVFEGDNNSSKPNVKLGHLQLKMKAWGVAGVDVDSKDFVMPIQNNMDIEVKNATIDVTCDMAFMPGSTIRIHDDAVINIGATNNTGVNVYIYDRGARKLTDTYDDKGNFVGGYWGSGNSLIKPLGSSARPGGILYGHIDEANGKFVAGRTEVDLVDARLIVNGRMNVYGSLYTVKGTFANEDTEEPEGGADITSEGSGKIFVYKIGNKTVTYQWKQGANQQSIDLTTPNLLLHNDVAKQPADNKYAYTEVKKPDDKTLDEYNAILKNAPLEYTYYRHDGTWRLPEAGITGIKLYDAEDNEINNFYVTLPNANVTGYLLATLEPIEGVTYELSDFNIQLSEGNVTIVKNENDEEEISIVGEQLRIPVKYNVQNKDGEYNQTLTITNSMSAEFQCGITEPIKVVEDYTPIFTAPTALNIYARINERTPTGLPIQSAEYNVTTLSEDSNVKIAWEHNITGTHAGQFAFEFGVGAGNKLSGAQVFFIPNSTGKKTATLTLTATYTDANDNVLSSEIHTVSLTGNGLMIDNTLDFNNVGTITTNSSPFELLENINSTGKITYTLTQVGTDNPSDVLDITKVDANNNSNYTITPKTVGQVKITVSQVATSTHTAKTISTTIVIVADPRPLTEVSCVSDATTFKVLTSGLDNVTYNTTNSQIQFTNTAGVSTWTAHFNSMPGTLTFTPHGNGYWAIQESKDGVNWSEVIWWTQLPTEEVQTIPLHPTSRKLQIAYIPSTSTDLGYITALCINPFTIHAAATKIYAPVVGGVVQPTAVVFTHSSPSVTFACDGLTVSPTIGSTENLGGVLNTYYQTTVIITGGTNVQEKNDRFTLTATQGADQVEVALATYTFPKPLPIQSATWKTNNSFADVNGYDEAEQYYWYMVASDFVKWDAERQNVVFLNTGSAENPSRQVVFGYYGLPDEVRFQSLRPSSEWKIEESSDNVNWSPAEEGRVVSTENGMNAIVQPINHTSKYVRVTYIGTEQTEVLLNNLVIEGFPSAVPNYTELEISKGDDPSVTPSATFNIHVMNLDKMQLHLDNTEFKMYYQATDDSWVELDNSYKLDSEFPFLAMNEEGYITVKVEWGGTNMVNEGYIQILNPDDSNKVLATVRLVGKKSNITKADANTGIWTGVPTGYTLADDVDEKKRIFEPYTYHEVNVQNAFDDNGNALFNYMVIYGETTTTDNSLTITRPNSTEGSNAKTPYYIYERAVDGKSYKYVQAIENANSAQKANLSEITHFTVVKEENGTKFYAIKPTLGEPLSFYMTGFCPYATTGSTKDDEGVWHFHGEIDDQIHIYLEDCHIYSRTKSVSGHTTSKTGEDSPDFDEDVVKGSGAVLVFENANPQEGNPKAFNVSIHTRGHNLLKSNYGCYYKFIGTLKATQISSPVQVRLGDAKHFSIARTELNFDDVWPIIIDDRDFDEHTNGFLSLKKQSNNAPSIDLGNANTVVNFRGGQVQLQNAQIVSPNYKTTLAISYRSGLMGNVNIPMAYGIGTDEVGGTVNFYDGTTTVVPMTVQEEYREYYLMDQVQAKNEDNTPKVDAEGNPVMVDGTTTTCLRTPTNTYVYGGSHCMMRACNHVTSKGGAPKDGPTGVLLGRYVYNNTNADQGYTYRCVVATLPTGNLYELGYREGYELIYQNNRYVVDLTNNEWDLIGPAPFTDPCYIVTPTNFPGDLQYNGAPLSSYYSAYPNGEYSLHSVTPDANGDLSFWVPGGVVPGVAPEEDKQLSAWKACMTEIEAGLMGITGTIGGNTSVEFDEEVKNLLYCQLDQNIYDIISEPDPNAGVDEHNKPKGYTYQAPVVDPTGMWETKYLSIPPTYVGDLYNSIVSENDYIVTNKIYYVTTALADTWMNFTMPFDVEKIWVVETFSEAKIEEFFAKEDKTAEEKKAGETDMDATLRFQARHNADFAAFFGVAMAIGDNSQTFEDIYDGYIDWAKNKADKDNGLYTSGTYSLRGKYPLTHYDGSNFKTSNFYLYKNTSDWTIKDADNSEFVTKWQIVPKVNEGDVLMEKGETYSMLFPYCLGCDVQFEDDNTIKLNQDGVPKLKPRDYWDYWSGKFLIFESTQASLNTPHVVKGSNYIEQQKVGEAEWLFDSFIEDEQKAVLTGNSTFAMMPMEERGDMLDKIYTYTPDMGAEKFYPYESDEDYDGINEYPVITPTSTFLYVGTKMATPAKLITRDGRIVYGPTNSGDGNTTGTHMPTVGGGNDLFITAINGGINVAVAAPQHVRVLSATGATIYSGMVQTAVDVNLPTDGIYIVSGEHEVQKILY